MIDLLYIRNNNFEHTCIKLYNFLKDNEWSDDIYVVLDHDVDDSQRSFIKKIYDVQFITPLKFAMLHSKSRIVQEINNQHTCTTLSVANNTAQKTSTTHAIFLYVYYTEFIEDICSSINKFALHTPCDLFVSICDVCLTQEQDIVYYRNYINSKISKNINLKSMTCTVNRGRDVRPFLQFIDNKQYKPYKYICKIHTKKTTYLSPNWRQEYMKILLESTNIIPELDMSKPDIYNVSQFSITESFNTGNSNYNGINKLASMTNIKIPKNYKFTYNAGTMFWCNNIYCDTINNLIAGIELDNIFEAEPIPSDGSIAHAWERFFFIL